MAQLYTITDLTTEQKGLIKGSVPLLELAGETLTKTFYQYMLSTYPEVKALFNEKNQADLRQPKLLAFALLAYAKNIDDISPLSPFVSNIVDRHVGLMIEPEHYPIVGTSLITTMKTLLGEEVATPEFLEAWTVAYGNLARILIDAEAAKYKQQSWHGYRDFKVTKVVPETAEITSVYLTPVDGGKIAVPVPGQALGFFFTIPGQEFSKTRNYTISNTPVENEYRISVKKVGPCSGHVHTLKTGDVIKVSPPNGHLTYNSESKKDVTIFAAGVGITPFVSIISAALKDGKLVELYYSSQSEKLRPFGEWFKLVEAQYPGFKRREFFSDEHRLTAQDIQSADLDNKDVYILGPARYLDFLHAELTARGVEYLVENYYPQIE